MSGWSHAFRLGDLQANGGARQVIPKSSIALACEKPDGSLARGWSAAPNGALESFSEPAGQVPATSIYAGGLDVVDMHKNIGPAIIGQDEAKPGSVLKNFTRPVGMPN